jgi:hypothetical protein
MKRWLPDFLVLFFLAICAALYCHRFYGAGFLLEGDSLFWAYLRLNADLLKHDHNPYIYYYASLFNWSGPFNPLVAVITPLVHFFYSSSEAATKAVLICMWTGYASTTLLSWSVYATTRYFGLKKLGASLSAVIVPYTGFSTVAIREFSVMYHISFMMVGPATICVIELHRTLNYRRWVPLLALAVGTSLLGGSNVPMFYYLPLLLLTPLFFPSISLRHRLSLFLSEGIAMGLAFLVAAGSLFPALRSLYDSNRRDVDFVNILHSMPPAHKLMNLLFRDWWTPGRGTYHEQDCFLGIAVVCLAIIGGIALWKERKESAKNTIICRIVFLFLFWGILVMHHTFLPMPLFDWIRKLYNLLSFRNSNRFFLLALLPAAYLAGLGLERLRGIKSLIVLFLGVLLQQWLVQSQLFNRVDLTLPDIKLAATLGLTLGYSTLVVLTLLSVQKVYLKVRLKNFLSCIAVALSFLFFFFSPIQLTGYTIPYLFRPDMLAVAPGERLEWKNILGLTNKYEETFSLAKFYLTEAPPYLQGRDTLKGRIYDPNKNLFLANGHLNFFAPQTGHQFVFPLPENHTTSRHMYELYNLGSEAVMDLAGVCWKVPEVTEETLRVANGRIYPYRTLGPVAQRPGCLPPMFLVSGFLPLRSDSEVLQWMKNSTRDDFSRELAMNCSGIDCSKYQDYVFKNSEIPFQELANRVSPRKLEPGQFDVVASSPQPTFLFLSTLFHPEWKAVVNGKPAPVLRVNHAFMAIPLGSGVSRVQLVFKGTASLLGKFLTVFVSLLLALIWISSFSSEERNLARLFTKVRLPKSAEA